MSSVFVSFPTEREKQKKYISFFHFFFLLDPEAEAEKKTFFKKYFLFSS